MEITSQVVTSDAADLAAESSFWAGVLGGTVDPAGHPFCLGSVKPR
jgi:hypothetical protein